jgi:hypothetical protein
MTVTWRGTTALVPLRGREVEVDCSAFAAALGDGIDVIARIDDVDFAQNEDGSTALVMRVADHDRGVLNAAAVVGIASTTPLTIDVQGRTFTLTDLAFRDGDEMRLELGWTEATA